MGLKVYGFDLISKSYMNIPMLRAEYGNIKDKKNKRKLACILTEYCSKGNLLNYILLRKKNNQKFQYNDVKLIISSFIGFFTKLQEQNIAHRDIKPQNIYITENEEYKIGDFGSSKVLQSN